jgi:hypothetical protein
MTIRCLALAGAVLGLLAGCGGGDDPLAPPGGAAAYSGAVVEVAEGRVLVRAGDDACGIWLAPADDVVVLRESGDGYEPAAWDDLEPGQSADVWISGPIAESCPMQAAADAVAILSAR